MSSDNIFTRKSAVNNSIRPTNLFKDRSTPYQNPQDENKKKKKKVIQPNDLLDVDVHVNPSDAIANTLLEKLTQLILKIIGKQKQWHETKAKLQALQNRISDFETVVKTNSTHAHSATRGKDFSV